MCINSHVHVCIMRIKFPSFYYFIKILYWGCSVYIFIFPKGACFSIKNAIPENSFLNNLTLKLLNLCKIIDIY